MRTRIAMAILFAVESLSLALAPVAPADEVPSVSALVERFTDPDALLGADEIPDPEALVRRLKQALPRLGEPHQVAAARLLGQLGPAGQPLIRGLFGDRRYSPRVRYEAGAGLAVGTRDVVLLLDVLGEGRPTLSMLASSQLQRHADDRRVIVRARRLMREKSPVVRRQMVRLLGWGRDAETARLIERALDDGHASVQSAALIAAGQRRLERLAPRLVETLLDGEARQQLRLSAARGLVDFGRRLPAVSGRRDLVAALVGLFDDSETDAFLRASLPPLMGAAAAKDARVVAALARGLTDGSPMVRAACAIERARGGRR